MRGFHRRPVSAPPGGFAFGFVSGSRVLDRLECAIERDLRGGFVEHHVQVVFELLAFLPLSADERRRANVRNRIGWAAFPGDVTDEGIVVGLCDGIPDCAGLEFLRALKDVDRNFEVGVLEADRLKSTACRSLLRRRRNTAARSRR